MPKLPSVFQNVFLRAALVGLIIGALVAFIQIRGPRQQNQDYKQQLTQLKEDPALLNPAVTADAKTISSGKVAMPPQRTSQLVRAQVTAAANQAKGVKVTAFKQARGNASSARDLSFRVDAQGSRAAVNRFTAALAGNARFVSGSQLRASAPLIIITTLSLQQSGNATQATINLLAPSLSRPVPATPGANPEDPDAPTYVPSVKESKQGGEQQAPPEAAPPAP